jgi:predicted small lipoprotein YifL
MRSFTIKTVFLLVALSLAIGVASCGKKAPPEPPDGLFRALNMFGK